MHSKLLRLALLLAVTSVAVVGIVTVARAQTVPVQPNLCYKAAYDLNHDNKVNEFDMNRWKDLLFKSGPGCYNGAVSGACPAGMDINGNGKVEFADLMIMLDFMKRCMTPQPYVVPG